MEAELDKLDLYTLANLYRVINDKATSEDTELVGILITIDGIVDRRGFEISLLLKALV